MALAYNVYNGETKVATEIAEKTFTVDGLTAETEYTFGVTAVQDGVESAKATLKVTTAAAEEGGGEAFSASLEKPTDSNTVAEIKAYLDMVGTDYPSSATKAELLALV